MPQASRWAPRIGSSILVAIPMYVAGLTAAPAHSGHAHEQSGFDVDGLLDVAATAAAIVILYVLATWLFRYRDRGKG